MLRFGLLMCVCIFFLGCAFLFAIGLTLFFSRFGREHVDLTVGRDALRAGSHTMLRVES